MSLIENMLLARHARSMRNERLAADSPAKDMYSTDSNDNHRHARSA
jgi:hypothetical protein